MRKIFVCLFLAVSIISFSFFGRNMDIGMSAAEALQHRMSKMSAENTDERKKDGSASVSPAPHLSRTFDIGKLYGLDSRKIGWGVSLKGNYKAPEIDGKTKSLFNKYNAHYIGDTAKKKVYFVFSASYEGGYTSKILDVLKANDVKAVFFLVGTYMKESPQLVRRMIDEGHYIGNHSMNHPSLPLVSDERLRNEIISLEDYVWDNFGIEMKYFMPPSGEYSEKVLAAAKELNYTSIFWSIAYMDYEESNQKGTPFAYNKIISNLHNGAIIFLHTVSKDNANALDSIIKEIKREGYTISPMDL